MGIFGRRGVRLTREQQLAAIPVRNQNIEIRRDDAGTVTITIPWRRTRLGAVLGALLMLPRGQRRRVLELDEVGSYVFDLCDGRRPVKTIVDILSERYKLSRKEAALSILTYLGQLARRGVVALLVPTDEARRREPGAPRRRRRKDITG